jgi:arylsulfatase
MTTYEGGVRVISMLRWPGVIKPGQILNGIQAHMDMFTSFAAAAHVPDVVEKMRIEKKQYIDGINNLDYWRGNSTESARDNFLYYFESKLMAIRMGPWKVHFQTREHYYDIITPQLIFFNIRSDPFESYDSKDSFGHLEQRVSWLFQPMTELVGEHLKTLAQYPPVQGGTSFDMSNVVEDFLHRSRQ